MSFANRGEFSLHDLPMRPWAEIEPDAIAWAKQWFGKMDRPELRDAYGKGARMLSDAKLRNALVRRFLRDSMDRWSRDVSAGRPVAQRAKSEGE